MPPETGWCWIREGKPEPGSSPYGLVAQTWEGSHFQGGGERQQEEMQLCFGSQRSLDDLLGTRAFRDCAATLLEPILGAVLNPSSLGRR